MVHSVCYKYFSTFPHDDLFNQGIVIYLEVKDSYFPEQTTTKFSTWLHGQLQARLSRYIKKNMIQTAVPHNVTPDFTYGDIDNIPPIHKNLISQKLNNENRSELEEKEDLRIAEIKELMGDFKRIKKHEATAFIDLILQGCKLNEASRIMGKKDYWGKQTLPRIIEKIEKGTS